MEPWLIAVVLINAIAMIATIWAVVLKEYVEEETIGAVMFSWFVIVVAEFIIFAW